nr:hypothetical protein BaRGS_027476 [Batillaria attramentaria]
MSQLMSCVIKDHPEYLLTVLTKMDKPTSMESPDFMCSNPGLMSDVVKCFLEYIEGCMPPGVAKQVAAVMPTHDTVLRGVSFLCDHRQDFDNPCVANHVVDLTSCFSNKLQAFTSITSPTTAASGNVQDTLCRALQVEQQCMEKNLQDCPSSVSSSLMQALLTFFPSENCNIKVDSSLKFQPRVNVHH